MFAGLEEDAMEDAAALGSTNILGKAVTLTKVVALGIGVGLDLVACLGGDNLDTDETWKL